MITFVGLHPRNHLVNAGVALERGRVQVNPLEVGQNPRQAMLEIFQSHPAHDSIHLIAL